MLLPEAVPILLLGLVTALSSEALHRFVDSDHFGSFDFPELEAAQYEVEIQNAPLSELELEGNTKVGGEGKGRERGRGGGREREREREPRYLTDIR